jgi:hypothetical protein
MNATTLRTASWPSGMIARPAAKPSSSNGVKVSISPSDWPCRVFCSAAVTRLHSARLAISRFCATCGGLADVKKDSSFERIAAAAAPYRSWLSSRRKPDSVMARRTVEKREPLPSSYECRAGRPRRAGRGPAQAPRRRAAAALGTVPCRANIYLGEADEAIQRDPHIKNTRGGRLISRPRQHS